MSVLNKIREKSTLLLIIIGGALVAFILGDVLTSGERLFGGRRNEVGNVAGQTISVQEFEARVQKSEENYKLNTGQQSIDESTRDMLRQQTWIQLLNEVIMEREYTRNGITVSSQELFDMVAGADPHPSVRQAFTDPQTGMFDQGRVLNFLRTMDQDPTGATKQRWLEFERSIKQERINEKYNNLINKGLYVPRFLAEHDYVSRQKNLSIRFLAKRYNEMQDSEISFSDSDLKDYYNRNKKQFEQEESRKIDYVIFEVNPSQEDLALVEENINQLKIEFQNTQDDTTFLRAFSDGGLQINTYGPNNIPFYAEPLMDAQPGTVTGPVKENNIMRLAKLVSSRLSPDSVRARHILISIQEGDTARAMAKADSLKRVIRAGKKFSDMAETHSEDFGSAQKGGDLEWFTEGVMVKPFNDAVFQGKKGDMPIVVSQFGVHLIEITDRSAESRRFEIALLEASVEPSNKTYNEVYVRASDLASKNRTYEAFRQAIQERNINVQTAENVRPSDRTVPGINQSRELVRWAFRSDEGSVSNVLEFDNKFVVAAVVEAREDGVAPLERVRDRVEREVIKEKKAEKFTTDFNAALAGANSIDDVANKLGRATESADNVNFAAFSIPGMGREPAVLGTAFSIGKDVVSAPIKGETGVFVIKVTGVSEAAPINDYSFYVNQISSNLGNRVSFEVFEALKEKVGVTDNRYKFY
jgi:peptidyl-prolyl cis-trans isomerase D